VWESKTPILKKMNKINFGFYLIRFSGEKPVFLVAIGPLSDEFWWKGTFLGSILVKVFYLYQGLCEYQKWDLSKTIFTLIPPKVTLKDPAIGPLSEFFNFFSVGQSFKTLKLLSRIKIITTNILQFESRKSSLRMKILKKLKSKIK